MGSNRTSHCRAKREHPLFHIVAGTQTLARVSAKEVLAREITWQQPGVMVGNVMGAIGSMNRFP